VGKKRTQVRQVRQQMRKVQPKTSPAATPAQTRRQRERFVQGGGMLQGYAPDLVIRIGYIAIAVGVVCLLAIAALLIFLSRIYGLPVAIAAAIAWVLPIALLVSFVAPGFRLAFKDRKAESRLVQGQLMGASTVSTSVGLGMLMVQTRAGAEQYLVPPARLKQVPGNQVSVVLTVTPNLRHVKSVGIMGQRMVGRVEPPVPPVMKRLQLLPLITPIALAVAAVVGDDAVAIAPISPSLLHASLAILAGTALAAAVYGVSFFLQRRMMAEVQKIVPKT
jgi:putative flippase GtrA